MNDLLTRLMVGSLAEILTEGRANGKSPAALVDAVTKDLRAIAENNSDMDAISNTVRVVYGDAATEASKARAADLAEKILNDIL